MKIHNQQLLIGDNLDRMRSMPPDYVDLIYMDPPFKKNKIFSCSTEDGERNSFSDIWTLNDLHLAQHISMGQAHPDLYAAIEGMHAVNGNSWLAYLSYMSIRLLEMRRILKPNGAIYYHCDPEMSHGVKIVMDAIFGVSNFRNEIIWCYSGGGIPNKDFPRKHDTILRYIKLSPDGTAGHYFAVERKPYKKNTQEVGKHSTLSGGKDIDLARGTPVTDWWTDIKTATGWARKTNYPTEKPLGLLERIISTSSKVGDRVMDPFCGCSTTLVAAAKLRREWVGIDISPKVEGILKKRLKKEKLPCDFQVEKYRKLNMRRGHGAGHARIIKFCMVKQSIGNDPTNCYCNGCGVVYSVKNMQVDHVHPKGKGGVKSLDNAQLLCAKCNSLKGMGDMATLYKNLASVIKKPSANTARTGQGSMFSEQIFNLIQKIAAKMKNK